jgi:hypothetical protein
MIVICNIAFSWGLFLLIWLVQIIIYPGFHHIPSSTFVDYHRWYTLKITALVLPLMIGEIIFLGAWWWTCTGKTLPYVATLAVAVVWLSTFKLQVPIHKRLQHGKDKTLIRRLVTTNWLRTAGWSLKAGVVTLAAFQNSFV